jgi:squalene-hopene/tetraprenyl-beta-curcumene cyclase
LCLAYWHRWRQRVPSGASADKGVTMRDGASEPPGWPDATQLRWAALDGVRWLLSLQNRDGGWPTFCRGWGTLPFDRSGSDLTAHALRALAAWRMALAGAGCDAAVVRGIDGAVRRGLAYLVRTQLPDGSWLPRWFGDQDHPDEANPIYGTARVLMAFRVLEMMQHLAARRGIAYLNNWQHRDGGWGTGLNTAGAVCCAADVAAGQAEDATPAGPQGPAGRSTVEHTALAVEALLADADAAALPEAVERGLLWLMERVERGEHAEAAPMGFYFAKLWYYERLYPLTFTASVLGRAAARLCPRSSPTSCHG